MMVTYPERFVQAFDMRLGLSIYEKVGKTMSFVSNILPRKEQDLKVHLIQGSVIGVVLTGLSLLVGLQFEWLAAINWLEAFAVFTSYLCTFLCVVERRANYIVGVITTAAYCYLFFQWGLFASMAVNAYLVFALAYGWFRWKSDSNPRPVTHLEWKWVPAYVVATAIGYAGVVAITSAIGATLPLADSVILIGTLLAQFLLDNKKIETWYVWAVVNVFAIYTYFTAGLTLAAFQFLFFLANTVYGYVMWKKSKNKVSNILDSPSFQVGDWNNDYQIYERYGTAVMQPKDSVKFDGVV